MVILDELQKLKNHIEDGSKLEAMELPMQGLKVNL
jgi:hypothetical protein